MRFAIGPIPTSRVFDAEKQGWNPLDSPHVGRFVLVAILLTMPFLLGAVTVLVSAGEDFRAQWKAQPTSLIIFLIALLLLVPVHELIHAITYWKGLRSPHLVMGIWPGRGLCYVIYDSPMPRHRILIMLAAPFVVLSVLPSLCLPLVPWPVRGELLVIVLVHAAVCAGDFLVFAKMLMKVPPGAWIHNNGWRTYWSERHEDKDV